MITINMGKQEYFDKTVEHMARQGERSTNNGVRVYRSKNGLKCNFGIFIPDGQYKPYFEKKGGPFLFLYLYGG